MKVDDKFRGIDWMMFKVWSFGLKFAADYFISSFFQSANLLLDNFDEGISPTFDGFDLCKNILYLVLVEKEDKCQADDDLYHRQAQTFKEKTEEWNDGPRRQKC